MREHPPHVLEGTVLDGPVGKPGDVAQAPKNPVTHGTSEYPTLPVWFCDLHHGYLGSYIQSARQAVQSKSGAYCSKLFHPRDSM